MLQKANALVTYVGWVKGAEAEEVVRGSSVGIEPGVLLSLSSEGVRSSVPGYV